jgi:hypothetical protein
MSDAEVIESPRPDDRERPRPNDRERSRYEMAERSEPALLVGTLTGVAGLLGLLAANFSLPHSAGLAIGMTVSQALFTRPATVTRQSYDELLGSDWMTGKLTEVIGAAAATPRPDEPVASVGALVFLAGFLVQLFAGVDVVSAFASAAAIAGVQTTATRARVYSPANAQRAVARRIARDNLPAGGASRRRGTTAYGDPGF